MSDWNFRDQEEAPSLQPKALPMDPRTRKQVLREARYYAELIPRVLAECGYDHWLRKESRPEPIERFFGAESRQKIKIIQVAYNETNIYFRIDPLRLPYRVLVPMLNDPDVLETVSAACGRKVTFQLRNYENGVWFNLNRTGVLSSIPKIFPFKDAINHIKEGSAPLAYCAGVTENMRLVMANIEEMPHMLIAGGTTMGKSVHLHSIICQLLWRNSPTSVKFLMIDLKGGMELADYSSIPHLWQEHIIKEVDDVVPALQAYRHEMKRRQDMFAGTARNMREYNSYHADKLPYIVLIIDELAQVLTNPNREMANQAMLELGLILATSRATGGHVIVCTQHPSVKVVDGYLKSNIDARVAFKTATDSDSRVIIDVSDAADLPIRGRAIFLNRADRVMIQGPWISPFLIRRTVKAVMEREHVEVKQEVGIVEVVQIGISRFGGKLDYRSLFDELKGRISQDRLKRMLSEFDNELITVGDKQYQIVPGSGQKPRHAELIEFEEPALIGGDNGSWN